MKSLQQMRRRLKKSQQNSEEKPVEKVQQPVIDEAQNINSSNKDGKIAETQREVEQFIQQKQQSQPKIQQVPHEQREIEMTNREEQQNKAEQQNQAQFSPHHHQPSDLVSKSIKQKSIDDANQSAERRAEEQFSESPSRELYDEPVLQLLIERQVPIKKKPSLSQKSGNDQNPQPQSQIPVLQPKKSKVQMLRQKIRLKKLAEQLASSNLDIEQSSFKRQSVHQLQSPVKEHQASAIQNVEASQQHFDKEKDPSIEHSQQKNNSQVQPNRLSTQRDNQDYRDNENHKQVVHQASEMQLESHHAPEQKIQQLVQDKVETKQNLKIKENQVDSFINLNKKSENKTEICHTLFHQLNELNQYLAAHKLIQKSTEPKGLIQIQSDKKVKQFVEQIQRLKKNLGYCQ